MIESRRDRGLADAGGCWGEKRGMQGNVIQRRQDKSADLGRAHVVGFVGYSRRLAMRLSRCISRISQRFQRRHRHRSLRTRSCRP